VQHVDVVELVAAVVGEAVEQRALREAVGPVDGAVA
jgi:hypothetical protein